MKVLVYHTSHGPTAVFLPPKGDQVPDFAEVPVNSSLTRPAHAQVAAKGPKATWDKHCAMLAGSPPYAGKWTVQDVPDGISAGSALARVRYEASLKDAGQEERAEPGNEASGKV